MSIQPVAQCSTCGDTVMRAYLKDMPRKHKGKIIKRRVYGDSNGHQWNGRECPKCKYASTKVKEIA